jgi:hypothetical protein
VGNGTENTYAYYCLHEHLQAMLLTASGNNIMEMEKQSATDSRF